MSSDLKVLRVATEAEISATGPGRPGKYDSIVAELAARPDVWCVVYEGPDAKRVTKVAQTARVVRDTKTVVRLSGDKVLMMRPSSPAPLPSWRPEGLPALAWSSLTPRDRERAAVAVARAPKSLRAAAIAELEVTPEVLEQTMKLLRTKGLL